MNLFIRLKSNPHCAANILGEAKNMYGIMNTLEARRVPIRRPKDGQVDIIFDNEEVRQIDVNEVIAEVKEIAENKGISLTHG